ncbi:MAG: murein biosynthesis integral membrane protein MurJ [Alphaproteobacteria bacterium]|nr:murein biosynthesis integral membrane protein MurJ [Alphaproteobacteria bacterium]MDE2336128.1 murein biosynthesis integral membrane protein MurJ [Alphaproteobacteria bacterium]
MSFYKAVTTVGGYTLASRLMGFARDILTASFLGAGPVADAFFIALKLPNFFRRITAEGAFSVAFVPMFSKIVVEEGEAEAKTFAEEAQAMMLAALLPFTVVCMIAMPWLLYVIAPGVHCSAGDPHCSPLRFHLAVTFSRITFPYILMMSLTALLGGVLNSLRRFAAFAAAPMFFNGTLIAALLFFAKKFPTAGHALAWGVAAAGVIQFLWMAANCLKHRIAPRLRRPKLTPRIRKLFRLMLPGAIGAGATQINIFIDMILASLLPVGSISYLYYADRLYQFPLGVIGVAIGTALLPMLSQALKSGKNGEAVRLLTRAFETGLMLTLPAALGLIVLAGEIMSVLFQRGAFTAADSVQSSHALIAYASGLPAFVLAKVFSTAYFAREDTGTPVKFAVSCAVINTLLALALIAPLRHVGIALATAVTAWINLALLVHGLHKRRHLDLPSNSVKRAVLIFAAGLVMAAAVYGLDTRVLHVMAGGLAHKALDLAGLIGAGGVVYFGCLYLFGIFNAQSVKALFPKRKKQDTIKSVQRMEEEE